MNKRFPVLSAISSILRFFGWAIALIGSIYFLSQKSYGFIVLNVVTGLFVVAFGESIGVLFAIEENTRTAANRTGIKWPRYVVKM